jgi:hypothetical protein
MGQQHRRRSSQKHSDVGSFLPRQHSRGLALAIVCLLLLGGSYTIWVLARPLYWRLYAEVIHRYQSDPAFVTSNGGLDSGKPWHGSHGLHSAGYHPASIQQGPLSLAVCDAQHRAAVSAHFVPDSIISALAFQLSSLHSRGCSYPNRRLPPP